MADEGESGAGGEDKPGRPGRDGSQPADDVDGSDRPTPVEIPSSRPQPPDGRARPAKKTTSDPPPSWEPVTPTPRKV